MNICSEVCRSTAWGREGSFSYSLLPYIFFIFLPFLKLNIRYSHGSQEIILSLLYVSSSNSVSFSWSGSTWFWNYCKIQSNKRKKQKVPRTNNHRHRLRRWHSGSGKCTRQAETMLHSLERVAAGKPPPMSMHTGRNICDLIKEATYPH